MARENGDLEERIRSERPKQPRVVADLGGVLFPNSKGAAPAKLEKEEDFLCPAGR